VISFYHSSKVRVCTIYINILLSIFFQDFIILRVTCTLVWNFAQKNDWFKLVLENLTKRPFSGSFKTIIKARYHRQNSLRKVFVCLDANRLVRISSFCTKLFGCFFNYNISSSPLLEATLNRWTIDKKRQGRSRSKSNRGNKIHSLRLIREWNEKKKARRCVRNQGSVRYNLKWELLTKYYRKVFKQEVSKIQHYKVRKLATWIFFSNGNYDTFYF